MNIKKSTSNKTKKLSVSTKNERYEWSIMFTIFVALLRRANIMNIKPIILISLSLAIVCMSSVNAHAQVITINDVRNKVFYSDFNLEKSISLIHEINTLNIAEPVVKAYEGATEMLAAKYSWNPVSKWAYLKGGIGKINEAVTSDELNIEIRFLRFYIENSLPHYLGLSKNTDTDKKVILDNIGTINQLGISKDIALFINQYMIDSGKCSSEEITSINEYMAKLNFTD